VKRLSPKLWAVSLALLAWGAADIAGLLRTVALAEQTNPSNDQSWSSSISSSVKRGFGKVGKALKPNPKPAPSTSVEDDAVSLKSTAKPGPNLNVAVARLYMQSDKLGDAEQQFQLALTAKPDFLPALLGYAELQERMGQPDAAVRLYQKAAGLYPQEASVYNNLGLCCARQGRLDAAESAMTRAIQLAPKSARYRNNMAMVLVDHGKVPEAFEHLRQVHGEAASYYNLGYLLNKKGQTQAAIQHFSLALRADPTMLPAQQWVQRLQRTTTQARLPQHPAAGALRITSNRPQPDGPRVSTSRPAELPPDRPERVAAPLPTTSDRTEPDGPRESTLRVSDSPPDRRERDSAPVPMAATEEPRPSLPEAPMPQQPRRLPPVPSREQRADGPSLPGISYNGNERPSASVAPLPPVTDSAVRHLPHVN
jgi:Tfp pilus assembly protein PilF